MESPFCWSVTANLEPWKCFNNWNDGIGITLCAKKVARTFVCLGKRRGEILGVGWKSLVEVCGWGKGG